MHVRFFTHCFICGLVAVLLAGAASGQEKYSLRHAAAAGDVCTIDSSMDMNLTLTVTVPGNEQMDQQLPFSERERQSYREKVLAVDAKGPSVVRRTYTIARSVSTDPDLHETTKVSSLQGKTVTIRRAGNQVTVTVESGKLSAEDEKSLAGEFSHPDAEYFPDHEVAPGDEWPMDPQLMRTLFPEAEKAQARYHFEKVVPYGGRPCAQIHVTVELQGPVPGADVPVTMQLSGDLYRALDLKRTVAEEESGPVTFSGTKAVSGVTARFSGQGTMRVKETHHWLTADGHPL